MIDFETDQGGEHLRFLVQTYTNEAGVRQLELRLRTLFLRLQRRNLPRQVQTVVISRPLIKQIWRSRSTAFPSATKIAWARPRRWVSTPNTA